jgi:hypothetical protein
MDNLSDALKNRKDKKGKMRKVMSEFKHGGLKSSSGQKVADRKQALAIALNSAGLSKKR